MLKKKENSLYNVRGRKLQTVYLAFDTVLGGNRVFCVCPTSTWRPGLVSVFAGLPPPPPASEVL